MYKNHLKNWFYISLSIVLFACKPSSEENTHVVQKRNMIVHHLKDEESFDKQSEEIDKYVLAFGKVASSLDYTKENGAFIHSDAHLDDNGKFLLIEESFKEPFDGEHGIRKYYFHKSKIFKTKELFNHSASNQTFIERISYYAPNGECLKTKERSGSSQAILDKIPFNAIAKTVCNVDKALRAINQEKEFRLTFQGFAKSQQGEFIILGEPGTNTFTTSLKVDVADPFIQNVKKDQYKYLNGTIYIQFEKVQEPNGITYQRLLKGSWEKL
jgi:hypothetical protein